MKIWQRVVCVVAIALWVVGSWGQPAWAIEPETPVLQKAAASAVSTSILEKLSRIQEDRELQELVEKDLERSFTIRAQIQNEVDRAFEHTTTLLNVMLAILTCLPVLAAIAIWFMRRSVVNQILAETKRELRDEVEKQLEAEVAAELKTQAEAFQNKLEELEAEFQAQLDQMKNLFSDTQKEKDRVIQELSQVMPSLFRDSTPPEVHQKIQALTQQLERLKSANAQLSFSANDYIEQGKALYFENRFEDAIACYDKALAAEPDNPKAWAGRGVTLVKLQQFEEALTAYDKATQLKPDFAEAWFGQGTILAKQQKIDDAIAAYDTATILKPDLFPAWFGKARCYALQNQADLALESLEYALQLNHDRTKEAAKTDPAFDQLRQEEPFQTLLSDYTEPTNER